MQATTFTPRRLGHVNLWVEDLDRSERFYHETCGLMTEFTEPELKATFMGVGHTQHDLGMMKTTDGVDRIGRDGQVQIPGTIGCTPGLNHIAWEVTSEAALLDAYRNLQRSGVPLDTAMDHQIAHSLYLFDPDGNYNEMYCDTVRDWRGVLAGEMDLITSKWNPEQAEGSPEPRHPVGTEPRTNPDAPLQPRRITHLVLETPQMEAMTRFYRDIVGLQVVSSHAESVFLRGSLAEYPAVLVLVRGDESRFHHASFELASERDVVDALERLGALGVKPVRQLDLPWKRSLFLRDPDGMVSEWFVPRPGAKDLDAVSREDYPYAV